MTQNSKKAAGFTLIELLIVIGIIGILSVVVMVSNNRSKLNARDARRVADVKEIYNALQVYYTDETEFPPDCAVAGYAGGCDQSHSYLGIGVDTSQDSQFVQFLNPTYLGLPPRDPLNNADYHYVYATEAEYPVGSGEFYSFIVGAYLENAGNNTAGLTPPSGQENFYVLGERW